MKHFIAVPLPPITLSAIFLIAGIGIFTLELPLIYLWLGISAISAGILFIPSNRSLKQCLIVVFAIISFCWGALWPRVKLYQFRNFSKLISDNFFTIEGIVYNKESSNHQNYTEIVTFKLKRITSIDNTRELGVNHMLKLYMCTPIDVPIGTSLAIDHVKLVQSLDKRNYDYHLIRDGIAATIFLKNPTLRKAAYEKTYIERVELFFTNLRHSIAQSLASKMSPKSYSLFASLFLGTNSNLQLSTSRKNFTAWGIAHYLARSGLHVVVIITVWGAIIRFLPVGFFFRQLLLLVILGIFSLLSYVTVSFTRAVLSYALARTLILNTISPQGIHIALLTCYIILAHNPFHIFFLNFQLSFILALAISWIYEIELSRKRRS